MSKKEIIKRVKFWQAVMGLTNWDIEVIFKELSFKKANGHYGDGLAVAEANSQYKLALITFLPSKLKDVRDDEIIHELLHCLFSPLTGILRANFSEKEVKQAWLDYFNEQVTTEVERIMMRLINPKKGEQIKL